MLILIEQSSKFGWSGPGLIRRDVRQRWKYIETDVLFAVYSAFRIARVGAEIWAASPDMGRKDGRDNERLGPASRFSRAKYWPNKQLIWKLF